MALRERISTHCAGLGASLAILGCAASETGNQDSAGAGGSVDVQGSAGSGAPSTVSGGAGGANSTNDAGVAGTSTGRATALDCPAPADVVAPAADWLNITGNLANMASRCGNLVKSGS